MPGSAEEPADATASCLANLTIPSGVNPAAKRLREVALPQFGNILRDTLDRLTIIETQEPTPVRILGVASPAEISG